MTWHRKLAFAALTVALVFGLLEGAARVVWWSLEQRSFQQQESAGYEILRNDATNFMKVADGMYGYTMKPNFEKGLVSINEAGFHQKDTVPVERTPGRLRLICLGESTTFGNDVVSNYPAYLRGILSAAGQRAEVINAGVPGWVSDQIALRAEHQLAAYKPDVVILYAGWNDFQSYDPLGPEPAVSYWEFAYKGRAWKQQATSWFRSVALLSALYHSTQPAEAAPLASSDTRGGHYKFLIQNLHRIVTAFRTANPDVKIFVSTLAGRWPAGTAEDWKQIAPVWWMPMHDVSVEHAAALVAALNDQLRQFARARNVRLIELAAAFQRLDRARLQYDWAHMISDGYELMAWTMYDALVEDGIVRPVEQPSRARQLRLQYALPAGEGVPVVHTRSH